MARCDLCKKTTTETYPIPSVIMQDAIHKGFDPFTTPGINMGGAARLVGLGDAWDDSIAYTEWKKSALVEGNDWRLCKACSSAFLEAAAKLDQNLAVGDDLTDTKPNIVAGKTQPNSIKRDTQPRPVKKNFPRWLAALIFLLLIVIGLLAGYGSGMGQRYDAQNTVVSGQLGEQFQLGQQAMAAGNYDLAKQYFEFIITTDSNYPGIVGRIYRPAPAHAGYAYAGIFSHPAYFSDPGPARCRGDLQYCSPASQFR